MGHPRYACQDFTLLYLPVILLGVFPLWFGWSGLGGSMIGAFIGGAYVEGLAPYSQGRISYCTIIYLRIKLDSYTSESRRRKKKKRLLALYGCLRFHSFHRNRLHSLAIHNFLALELFTAYSGHKSIRNRPASDLWAQLANRIDCMPSFN